MAYITLDRNAFNNNANYYCKVLNDINKLCIALKDNAYGHGINEISALSTDYGIKHCIVRDLIEANIANKYKFESILVLYDIPLESYPSNFIFSVNDYKSLMQYQNYSKIELKINTGMCRNGIQYDELNKTIELIKKKHLILNGVFTHFHSADEDNDSYIQQEKLFLKAIKYIKTQIIKPFRIHCSNSAAFTKIDHSKYDMVRIGIGMYGYNKSNQSELKQVLSLFAKRISTRILNKNDTIGYGATYTISEDNTQVSNYDIGYGDGFFRINETQKAFLENNNKILGRVSMDSLSTFGDEEEICIFHNASHLAKVHDTIEYEILTHLMPHIKRDIIN